MKPLPIFVVALGIGAAVGLFSRGSVATASGAVPAKSSDRKSSVIKSAVSAESYLRNAWQSNPTGSAYFVETNYADLLRWAEKDPHGLLRWAEDSGNFGLLERARGLAIIELIKTDFDGALAYMENADDATLIYRLANEIAFAVPEERISDLIELGPFNSSSASGRAYQRLHNRWVAADPDAALAALQDRKKSPEYELLGRRLFKALFQLNPDAAIERMVNESISSEFQGFADAALVSIFNNRGKPFSIFGGREAFDSRTVLKGVNDFFKGDSGKAARWLLERSDGNATGEIAFEYKDKGTDWLIEQIEATDFAWGGREIAYGYLGEKIAKEDPFAFLKLMGAYPDQFKYTAEMSTGLSAAARDAAFHI